MQPIIQTPAKLSLRERYKNLERLARTLKLNSDNATLVANAMFWKLGLKNRAEIKAIVDDFMAFTEAAIVNAKAERAAKELGEGKPTEEPFIDPVLLDKMKQVISGEGLDDSSSTDSQLP